MESSDIKANSRPNPYLSAKARNYVLFVVAVGYCFNFIDSFIYMQNMEIFLEFEDYHKEENWVISCRFVCVCVCVFRLCMCVWPKFSSTFFPSMLVTMVKPSQTRCPIKIAQDIRKISCFQHSVKG